VVVQSRKFSAFFFWYRGRFYELPSVLVLVASSSSSSSSSSSPARKLARSLSSLETERNPATRKTRTREHFVVVVVVVVAAAAAAAAAAALLHFREERKRNENL
jgi:glycerol uptake facilitator-like aquaporin